MRWILVPLATVCVLLTRSDGKAQSLDANAGGVSVAPRDGRDAAWQTSIRSDVNLAGMSFTVRDSHGALVDNLIKDDFEVFEDGVPQKIAFFARSADVPLTLGLS